MSSASIALFSIAAPVYIPRYIYPLLFALHKHQIELLSSCVKQKNNAAFLYDDLLVWACAAFPFYLIH